MHRNYLKMAMRYLVKNKLHSFVNIAGLSVGMTVAIMISLWIRDEFNYNQFPDHPEKIAKVMQTMTFNGEQHTGVTTPVPLVALLKENYSSYFKYIVISSWPNDQIFTIGDKNVTINGRFMDKEMPDLFSLKMLSGTRAGLSDPSSILLSQSAARALFGNEPALDKTIKMNNKTSFKVSGVYEDLPYSSDFKDLKFIGPWSYYKTLLKPETLTDWGNSSWLMFVQVADNVDIQTVSDKIRTAKYDHAESSRFFKPMLSLHPLKKWHLYNTFKNGINTGGSIQYVWLFGIIGIFVLLLACINFMNLSTAKSEKRAKEVGIRKSIGSQRQQLIAQFFIESLFVTFIAYILSLLLVFTFLPLFNVLADKKIIFPWKEPLFWIVGIIFTIITGLIAGSYPAFYLSSFQPIKVLKGVYKAGRYASMPRKVLVVLQFSISVMLIIGTIVVFEQIQFTRNRPVGYSKDGLVSVTTITDDIWQHFDAFRDDLIRSGMVKDIAFSTSATTGLNNNTSGLNWKGKDPAMADDFGNVGVTSGFGKTIGLEFTAGRDFNPAFASDSLGLILNEAAVKYMGLANPVGETIQWGGKDRHVIGVVKNMVMESPYEPVKQTFFYIRPTFSDDYLSIRINPSVSTAAAMEKIENTWKVYSPNIPFSYHFANLEYADKFQDEIRVGKLASIFAILAIFISCLGLFGMASFMAEQRTKEVGIRKILGASVLNLWHLLSKEFLLLISISLIIGMPLAHIFMQGWLEHYPYHTDMPWWAFVCAAIGAMGITLATVSFQSIRAALLNPVKSLRSE